MSSGDYGLADDAWQTDYFDTEHHRLPKDLLCCPPRANIVEMLALEERLGLSPKSHIIDFGAGNGRVSLHFLSKGYDVSAVDISQKSLDDLVAIYRKVKAKDWGRLKLHTSLPKNMVVDGIVGADVLHHVNVYEYMSLFYEIVRDGGKVAFSEPNWWHVPWYFHLWRNRIPWNIERGILQCSYTNLRRILENCKYRSYSIWGHGLLPTPYWAGRLNYTVGNIMPFKMFAFRLMIEAKK